MESSNVSTSIVVDNIQNIQEPKSLFPLECLESLRHVFIVVNFLLRDIYERYQSQFPYMKKVENCNSYTNALNNDKVSCESNLPYERDQNLNDKLKNDISETEDTFEDTMNTLRLFQTYLQWPSEETAKPLKLLFDRGKAKNFFTRKKMDDTLSLLKSAYYHQGSVDTTKRFSCSESDSDEEGSPPLGCQTDSISDDASRKDSEKKKTVKNPVIRRASKESLRQEVCHLKSQLKSVDSEREVVLRKLGEIDFIQKKKEREERSHEIFRQIFPPSVSNFETKQFSGCPGNGNSSSDGFRKPSDDLSSFEENNGVHFNCSTSNFLSDSTWKTTKKSSNTLPAHNTFESTLKDGHHQPGEKSMATRGKSKTGSQGGSESLTMQNVYSNNPREKATGEEGVKSELEEEKINTDMATILRDEEDLSIRQNKKKENKKKEKIGNERGANRNTGPLASTLRDEIDDQSLVCQSSGGVSFSVQQDDANEKEFISLASKPQTSVALTLYNNYKLLLLTLADNLLSSDAEELKSWTRQKFSIDNTQNATDVLFQLDEKGAINAEDLNELCGFFKSILRYDLVHITEAFLLGDYSLLRAIPKSKKRKKAGGIRNSQLGRISWNDHASASSSRRSSVSSTASGETVRNPATSGKPQNNNEPPSSGAHQIQQAASSSFSVLPNPSNPGKLFSRTPNENQSIARVQQDLTPTATGLPTPNINKMVVPNGSTVSEERRTMAANVSTRTSRVTKNTLFTSSNGLKHSKFQRPSIVSNSRAPSNSGNLEVFNVQDDNWLCSHYKRHCFVKFECCDKFWPCHRCHNNQSACGRKKLKSRDTKMLKCVYCNKEQQFGQFCCDCGAKFSNYFCGLCKHLTGHDDFPYHCEKCGICRIHGDRSFHCDVCGVCLDVQLQGNHKCREGSAHDECCICLEDAFTGCQILPCSHKVHKECATQMIRSGITRCPICRESFAHKLERRPTTMKKHSGK